VRADRPDRQVLITVRDRGPGFPEEFLPHAFERFRRANEARARHDGGAGLGLAVVSAVAHAHYGKASAANAPGGGAIVTLTFPQER
jgi:signal transduction histidine kinase